MHTANEKCSRAGPKATENTGNGLPASAATSGSEVGSSGLSSFFVTGETPAIVEPQYNADRKTSRQATNEEEGQQEIPRLWLLPPAAQINPEGGRTHHHKEWNTKQKHALREDVPRIRGSEAGP